MRAPPLAAGRHGHDPGPHGDAEGRGRAGCAPSHREESPATRTMSAPRKLGLPMWMDRWDGYPAARSRLLKAAQAADADLVMLSGDSHNAWAYALSRGRQARRRRVRRPQRHLGGMEGDMGADPKRSSPGLHGRQSRAEMGGHQPARLSDDQVTPQRVTGEWLFMKTIKARGLIPPFNRPADVRQTAQCSRPRRDRGRTRRAPSIRRNRSGRTARPSRVFRRRSASEACRSATADGRSGR
jgi:hypothetical protein